MLRSQCEHESAALGTLRYAPELARGLVMARIASPPSLAELASRTRLTVRQLRFALTRDGTSYQRLVRECRIAYFRELARNSTMSLAEIGGRLGYSDAAHFSAAIKRWTGQSPSDFRKRASD
jgi:AraC-like DNA-binding protein